MIEKRVFDKEYKTQWIKEVEFLKSVGMRYTYVKIENGVSTYKYTKNWELFEQLSIFYKDM